VSTPSDNVREFTPAWSVHPGEVLRSILEQRSIRQSELAERTGLTPKHVNQIVKGTVGISGDAAVLLERALDIPTRFWVQADADYVAYTSRQKAREQLLEFSDWADGFDAATLNRHNIIDARDDRITRIEKILKFFGVANPDAFDQTWIQPRVSFRRSQAFKVAEQNTALWLRLLERVAEQIDTEPLRPRALRGVARAIPAMTNMSLRDGFPAVRDALAEAGVVLAFVREVPGTRLCGATWWLGKDKPVIGVTERHRKADTLWFNIVHEIGHILLHPRRSSFLNLEIEKAQKGEEELEADQFAATTLLPEGIDPQIARASSRQELALLAARLGVGATIVAGRHGRLTDKWHIGSSLRPRITDADIDTLEQQQVTR
jgi:HTH-type transcriptional regulator/antitoxin HigA